MLTVLFTASSLRSEARTWLRTNVLYIQVCCSRPNYKHRGQWVSACMGYWYSTFSYQAEAH